MGVALLSATKPRWSPPSSSQDADRECRDRSGSDGGVQALEQAALSRSAVQEIADEEREHQDRRPADRSGLRPPRRREITSMM
jgi:hypothetical protein